MLSDFIPQIWLWWWSSYYRTAYCESWRWQWRFMWLILLKQYIIPYLEWAVSFCLKFFCFDQLRILVTFYAKYSNYIIQMIQRWYFMCRRTFSPLNLKCSILIQQCDLVEPNGFLCFLSACTTELCFKKSTVLSGLSKCTVVFGCGEEMLIPIHHTNTFLRHIQILLFHTNIIFSQHVSSA